MGLCQITKSDWDNKFLKYKGRVVLRGDAVRDDSVFFTVSNARGSSASRMIAVIVSDVYVDDVEMKGKKARLTPMWQTLVITSNFEEPTLVIGHVYLGCTQRESETKNIIVMEKSELFKRLVSPRTNTMKNFNNDTKHNVTSWSYDMQGQAHVLNDIAKWQTQQQINYTKVSRLCLDDHHNQTRRLETVGEL